MLRTFLALAVVAVCYINLVASRPQAGKDAIIKSDKESVLEWTETVRKVLDKWAQAGMDDTILEKELDPISENFPTDVSYQFHRNGKVGQAGIGYNAIKYFIEQLRQIHKVKRVLPGFPDPAYDLAAWEIQSADDKKHDLLITAKFNGERLFSYNLYYNW